MLSHPGPEETKQQCTIWTGFLVSCRSFLDAKLLGAAGPASLFWAVFILVLLSCSALPSPGPMSVSSKTPFFLFVLLLSLSFCFLLSKVGIPAPAEWLCCDNSVNVREVPSGTPRVVPLMTNDF